MPSPAKAPSRHDRTARPKKTAMREGSLDETAFASSPEKMRAAGNGSHSRHGSNVSTGSNSSNSSSNSSSSSRSSSGSGRPKRVAYALLRWDDLPAWRRDNAFIRGGYRPTSHSYVASLGSVLGLHNESVNIWTHLGGAVVAALLGLLLYADALPSLRWWWRSAAAAADVLLRWALPAPWAAQVHGGAARAAALGAAAAHAALRAVGVADFAAAHTGRSYDAASSTLVLSCFAAGAVACLGMSATYHALSNHSPAVARWGNKLDYSGIVFLIVGSYVPTLYYGFFCHPRWLAVYLYLIVLLGLACLAVSWLEHFRTPAWRPYRALLFVALGASGAGPIAHSLLLLEDGATLAARARQLDARMGLRWVLLQGLLYVAGAFLYAARWPERWRPGRFDLWGSSHQIFHVFVLLAAAAHLRGVLDAYLYHHNVMGGQCPPPPSLLL